MRPRSTATPRASFPDALLADPRLAPVRGPGADQGEEPTLVEKLRDLLRRRWLIVLESIAILGIATLVLSLAQDKKWTASATLLFQPPRQTSGALDPVREAATASKLVALPGVAQSAARRLGPPWTAQAVEDAVAVKPVANTNLIGVDATTTSPRTAANVANAYTAAFVASQDASSVAELRRRLSAYDRYFNSLPLAERQGPRGQRLQQKLDSLRISSALQSDSQQPTVQLRERAEPPHSPSSPKTARNVVLGLMLGAALGFALAAVMERLDRGVKSVDELERLYGLPILGRIPKARGLGRPLGGQGADLQQGPEAEAFRALRANLRYFNVNGTLRSLMVVSPDAEDGKSTVAACLAMTLAQRGDNVLLVETDMHKRRGDRPKRRHSAAWRGGVGDRSAYGLSTVLTGGGLDEALVSVPIDTADGTARELTILPSGPTPPNPSELLESQEMHELMQELSDHYDIVVYDTPAMGAVADALPLLPDSAGVLVVSRLHHTSRDRARELVKQLPLLRTRVLGVVANSVPRSKHRGHDYYYGT